MLDLSAVLIPSRSDAYCMPCSHTAMRLAPAAAAAAAAIAALRQNPRRPRSTAVQTSSDSTASRELSGLGMHFTALARDIIVLHSSPTYPSIRRQGVPDTRALIPPLSPRCRVAQAVPVCEWVHFQEGSRVSPLARSHCGIWTKIR